MRNNAVALVLCLCLRLLNGEAQAVQVNFSGTVVESLPCSINNNQLIEVDFGDGVIIRNLDMTHYRKTVPYQIVCSAPGAVRLSVTGTPTHFDSAAIQTNAMGLGIHLELAGVAFTLNTPRSIDLGNLPTLIAVPVADPVQPPSPGNFTARATLLADYQ
ncbi:fimbrial protein [Serratia aquatilis]|uniref:Fimbrial protein n=1 Tax=Serratia aquatilis TaxID=1737515 RepID=A0ABV6EIK5_9GAMM